MPKSWNPWQSFDLSEKERQLVEKRRQMREFWAEDFTRKSSSPYRPAHRFVFDPAIQRAIAARATLQDFFRPNRRANIYLLAALGIPGLYMLAFKVFYRDPFLKAAANGEIPYKNRNFKDYY